MASGDLLERVRFVKNDKVIGKKEPTCAVLGVIHRIEKCEKKRVVEDNHLGVGDAAAQRLIEATGCRATHLGRAEVLFAANLLPDGGVWLLEEIAE